MESATTRGRALVASLLPAGIGEPQTTIRARRSPAGDGIAITVWPHDNHVLGGEYRQTVVVPDRPGPECDIAHDRLAHLLSRWATLERATRLSIDERRACDGDDVEDDMPVPGWRTGCPAPLRILMDAAHLDHEARLGLVDGQGTFETMGAVVRLHESQEMRARPADAGFFRNVRRIEIEAAGVVFRQGVNKCQIEIGRALPLSAATALVGRRASDLIDLPGIAHPGILVTRVAPGARGIVETTRAYEMLSPLPGDAA